MLTADMLHPHEAAAQRHARAKWMAGGGGAKQPMRARKMKPKLKVATVNRTRPKAKLMCAACAARRSPASRAAASRSCTACAKLKCERITARIPQLSTGNVFPLTCLLNQRLAVPKTTPDTAPAAMHMNLGGFSMKVEIKTLLNDEACPEQGSMTACEQANINAACSVGWMCRDEETQVDKRQKQLDWALDSLAAGVRHGMLTRAEYALKVAELRAAPESAQVFANAMQPTVPRMMSGCNSDVFTSDSGSDTEQSRDYDDEPSKRSQANAINSLAELNTLIELACSI